jgi:hypothetical protein
MTSALISDLRKVVFTLRVRHAVTGGAIASVRATLIPPTPWWWGLAASPGLIGVHAPDRFAVSTRPPVVRLSITDPVLALVIAVPVVELTLTADTIHEFVPVPQTVTVDLVDDHGHPRTGRTVEALAISGTALPLPEVAGSPGTYRSAARTWTAADTPFDLEVDGRIEARHLLDPFRTDTRLRAVSPA